MDIEQYRQSDQDEIMFDRVHLKDADLSRGKARSWVIIESTFHRCDFSGSRGEFGFGAGQKMSEYVDCRFDGSRITAPVPGRARFIRCSFQQVTINKALFNQVEFIDCTFSGVIKDCNFNARLDAEMQAKLGRTHNRIERNDFSQAQLRLVAFKGGVDLLDQVLPQDPDYVLLEDAPTVVPALIEDVSHWSPLVARDHTLTLLGVYRDWTIPYGQKHILLSPLDWSGKEGGAEAYARLRGVIEARWPRTGRAPSAHSLSHHLRG